jgi:hypothetical protein
MFHMKYAMEGSGALVNEKVDEQPLKTADFAHVTPEGLTPVTPMRNTSTGIKETNPSR